MKQKTNKFLAFGFLTFSFWYMIPIRHYLHNLLPDYQKNLIKTNVEYNEKTEFKTLDKNLLTTPTLESLPIEEIKSYLPKRDYSYIDEQLENQIIYTNK